MKSVFSTHIVTIRGFLVGDASRPDTVRFDDLFPNLVVVQFAARYAAAAGVRHRLRPGNAGGRQRNPNPEAKHQVRARLS